MARFSLASTSRAMSSGLHVYALDHESGGVASRKAGARQGPRSPGRVTS